MENSHANLSEEYKRFLDDTFPEDSNNAELSDIHAELADYDRFVASQIVRVISGTRVLPKDLRPDAALRGRLEGVVDLGKDETRLEARVYLKYLEKLERLLAIARTTAR